MEKQVQAAGDGIGRQDFKFDVFISYRHAELDNAVAGYLQKALEHYRIPRDIQKRCGKKSIRRVFRDEEELGAASDLFGEIEQNLKQSEFLVVICSPRILESKWCQREIETFIRYRGRENILPVLIEGDPDTAFPPILREDGEPLAADLRGKNKREVLRHARERLARLAAPLLGCTYDELHQRRRVYQMRRILAAAGAVAAVSLAFGTVTLMQNREIQRQSREIQLNYQGKLENQSRYLAQTSTQLLEGGDRDAALLVALEALPGSGADGSRPYVAEARIALEQALYTYAKNTRYQLHALKRLEHREETGSVTDRSEEENVLLTTDAASVYIWDGASCENLCRWDHGGELVDAKLVGNHSAAVMTGSGALCFDYRTGQVLWRWDYPACTSEGGYCPGVSLLWAYDGQSNQILCGNGNLCLHDAGGGEAEVPPGHMFYLLDAATGESRAWMPAELSGLLEEGTYHSMNLERTGFALSPGGKWAAISLQPVDLDAAVTLAVFPVGGDGSAFSRELTRRSSLSCAVEKAVFLDEDCLAFVHITQGDTLFGHSGKSAVWELECRDAETGELQLSYQDVCMCLNDRVDIQKIAPPDGSGDGTILSVTYDNVAVNLDWTTGERLARIEDRSAIVLNHFFSTAGARQLIVTADGYLFATIPTEDMVWAPVYSAYHYYIGISRINQSVWLDGKGFFFTDSGVYCYAPTADASYAPLEATPCFSSFTGDSAHVLTAGDDGKLFFFDTDDFSRQWEDEYCFDYDCQTAALVEDRWAAYLTGDGTTVKLRALQDGGERQVRLDGLAPEQTGSGKWNLRAGGAGSVLVWNREHLSFGSFTEEGKADAPVLCVLDAETGKVTARRSCQDLLDLAASPFSSDQLSLYPEAPAATADGRYVLIPFRLSGYSEEDTAHSDRGEVCRVLVWDLETGKMSALPDEVREGLACGLGLGTCFEHDGWVSPGEDLAVFYNEARGQLQVVDLTGCSVLHTLAVEGIASQEISFTPDGDHLIFQDGMKRLCVYNWKKGAYTMQGVAPEPGHMEFAFYLDGEVLSAAYKAGSITSESTCIYRRTGEGVYKLETSISVCGDCDAKTVVISDKINPRLYHYYSLDELIAQAREILKGRELTPAERKEYLID